MEEGSGREVGVESVVSDVEASSYQNMVLKFWDIANKL